MGAIEIITNSAAGLVQVAVPVLLGWLVDSLGYGRIPYKEIVLYIVFRGLQGGQGAIGAARSVLWIPVSQGLFRRLSCAAFEHVIGLSMDFHLSKRIGEVTSALSRGAASKYSRSEPSPPLSVVRAHLS